MELAVDTRMMGYVVYIGVALGVFLALSGLAQMLGRRENFDEVRNRRIKMLSDGKSTSELLALLKPKKANGILPNLPFSGDLPSLLVQAGLTMSPTRFLIICGALATAGLAAGLRFFDPLPALALTLTVGWILPVTVLRQRRSKRTEALTNQLPDALDIMARGLKVGHPLSTSIKGVAEQMPDPIGSEFGIVFDSISYGDDLVDSFSEFAERVDIEDVHYLSASIGIQYGTGGDLARVIAVLAKVIRNRIAMRRKIHAISSEGRLTAWFLSGLPVAIFVITSISSPDYYGGVSEDPLFIPMMSGIVLFTVLNFLVLRKMTNFRI
ncbi:MAG: type II secretion system F family protein [Pseudomonadota bacterium]|jgi:tight adherence protein B|nr:type II secretion system F family protein [Pseudomonadota bacterium]